MSSARDETRRRLRDCERTVTRLLNAAAAAPTAGGGATSSTSRLFQVPGEAGGNGSASGDLVSLLVEQEHALAAAVERLVQHLSLVSGIARLQRARVAEEEQIRELTAALRRAEDSLQSALDEAADYGRASHAVPVVELMERAARVTAGEHRF